MVTLDWMVRKGLSEQLIFKMGPRDKNVPAKLRVFQADKTL